MPFKSKAQRRKFAQLLVEGKISDETYEEWNRSTGGTDLPERLGAAPSTSRKKPSAKKSPRKTAARKAPGKKAVKKATSRKASGAPKRKPIARKKTAAKRPRRSKRAAGE